jgi:hypothetical protein
MPRIKTANFVISVDSLEEDSSPGKRKRSDGNGLQVVGIRFRSNWCLRYRPEWNLSGASLMVYEPLDDEQDRVWECVGFQEHRHTAPIDSNGEYVAPLPIFVDPRENAVIGAQSFWGHFTTEGLDSKVKNMSIVSFEHSEEDRATMDLRAVVHVQATPHDGECRQYYSMRLELVRILN